MGERQLKEKKQKGQPQDFSEEIRT